MKYQRKIFYINKYKNEIPENNIGYVKMFQKGNQIHIELHWEENHNLIGGEIYLLKRDKHTVNKLFFGTIISYQQDVIMKQNIGKIEDDGGEVIGVIVEGEEEFLCGGTDDPTLRLLDYFTREINPEIERMEVEEKELQMVSENANIQESEPEEEEIIEIEMEVAHDEAYQYGKIFSTRENMYPFEDDEMLSCVQISPADFSDFPKQYWQLGSNSFLLQGYYNYRHLILAETESDLYIGIPGQYHRRDMYLADMFGFRRFKGIRKKQCQLGDFGYWLMAIQKPQPTEQWVSCGETCDLYQEME